MGGKTEFKELRVGRGKGRGATQEVREQYHVNVWLFSGVGGGGGQNKFITLAISYITHLRVTMASQVVLRCVAVH